jgi:hypothetical protein
MATYWTGGELASTSNSSFELVIHHVSNVRALAFVSRTPFAFSGALALHRS